MNANTPIKKPGKQPKFPRRPSEVPPRPNPSIPNTVPERKDPFKKPLEVPQRKPSEVPPRRRDPNENH